MSREDDALARLLAFRFRERFERISLEHDPVGRLVELMLDCPECRSVAGAASDASASSHAVAGDDAHAAAGEAAGTAVGKRPDADASVHAGTRSAAHASAVRLQAELLLKACLLLLQNYPVEDQTLEGAGMLVGLVDRDDEDPGAYERVFAHRYTPLDLLVTKTETGLAYRERGDGTWAWSQEGTGHLLNQQGVGLYYLFRAYEDLDVQKAAVLMCCRCIGAWRARPEAFAEIVSQAVGECGASLSDEACLPLVNAREV